MLQVFTTLFNGLSMLVLSRNYAVMGS